MTTITSSTLLNTGYIVDSDTTGTLVFKTGVSPTTAMSINSSQVVTFANPPAGVFPSGTALVFSQTAAPTGWTKSTTHNNKALRIVSGTAGSGGSTGFTSAFGTPSVSGTISVSGTVGATTLTTAQIPSHTHQAASYQTTVGWSGNSPGQVFSNNLNFNGIGAVNTGSAGSGGSHDHSFTGSGSLSSATAAINVAYVDAIIAVKD